MNTKRYVGNFLVHAINYLMLTQPDGNESVAHAIRILSFCQEETPFKEEIPYYVLDEGLKY
jgi:hypothetical protein